MVEVWTRTLNEGGRVLYKFFELEVYSKKDKKNCPSFVAEKKIMEKLKEDNVYKEPMNDQ